MKEAKVIKSVKELKEFLENFEDDTEVLGMEGEWTFGSIEGIEVKFEDGVLKIGAYEID